MPSTGRPPVKYASLRQVLRYRFDNFIAKGGGSIFISLVVVFVVALLVIAGLRGLIFAIYPEGAGPFDHFLRHVYITFLQLTDPGNMAQDIPTSAHYKLAAVMAGLAGVILLSMLIAIVTTALDQRIVQLKKGYSKVMEREHNLILGWNERVLEILRELILANESESDAIVVILSEMDKEEMDDYLKLHLQDRQTTRIVTRSGHTSSLLDLNQVSVDACKSAIVLANCNDSAQRLEKLSSDAKVIKTVLALVAARPSGKEINIVAEVFESNNRKIVDRIAPGEVTTVDTQDILAKILVQTSRSSGLAVVYGEILSFDGCEMYFYRAKWGGAKFGILQYHFPDGVPMGIRHADGSIHVNPPAETTMKDDDDILIVANDDSTIKVSRKPVARPKILPLKQGKLEPRQERNLILGWNTKALIFSEQLADYVRDNSVLDIVVNKPSESVREEINRLQQSVSKLKISLIEKNPLDNETLIELKPFTYDNIIILSQGSMPDNPERIDSETIIILLQLREIFSVHPDEAADTKIITEVLDSDNQELIAKAGVNDFVISNRFVSNMLAQISEEPDIKAVYDDLFEEEGSEIYLKPASLYFERCPIDVSFADIMAIAQKRNEICIGIRIHAHAEDIERNFGVYLIPEKNTRYHLQPNDTLVVVSEDEL